MTERYPLTNIDQIFDGVFRNFYTTYGGINYPVHDIFADGDDLVFEFALNGFKKEDITVEIENNVLTVKGEQERPNIEGRKYLQKKIGRRDFMVQYAIPNEYLSDDMAATFEDGILTILFMKKEEAKARKIDIS